MHLSLHDFIFTSNAILHSINGTKMGHDSRTFIPSFILKFTRFSHQQQLTTAAGSKISLHERI